MDWFDSHFWAETQIINLSHHLLLVEPSVWVVTQERKKKKKTSGREKETKDHQRSSTAGHYGLTLSKQAWYGTRQVVPKKVNTDKIPQTNVDAMFKPRPTYSKDRAGSWGGARASDLTRWYNSSYVSPFYNLLLLNSSMTSVKCWRESSWAKTHNGNSGLESGWPHALNNVKRLPVN